jgi:mannose-6-phosphate isomerase-like protein (cupin superfamily)
MSEVVVVNTAQQAAAPTGAPEDTEALHRDAESRIQPFAFKRPDHVAERAKTYVRLAVSKLVLSEMHIVPEGGANNLHYHTGEDGFWMVLQGRARFHGPDGPIGEYGPYEGVLIPHHARYWFETADPRQELHLLHVSGRQPRDNRRIDVKPRTEQFKHAVRVGFDAKGAG